MFGVVVELGTSRISDPTAFVACRSDHICWAHLATFEWAVHGGLAQHFTPKALCQCIELRFSFAVEWVGTCWAGLTKIA